MVVKEVLDKGYIFERTYKTIREVLNIMTNQWQMEVMKNSVSVKLSEYTVRRLESLGITVRDYPFNVLFRLERL